MKSPGQIVALVVVLVVLVFVITFVSQWVSNEAPQPAGPGPGQPAKGPLLLFPVEKSEDAFKSLEDPLKDREKIIIAELKPVTGAYDFWFKNQSNEEVLVGGEYKNCKCSRVELLNLTPEEEAIYQESCRTDGVRHWLAAPAGWLPYLSTVAAVRERTRVFLGESSRWQRIIEEKDEQPIVVPAGGTGLVRLCWEGRQEGQQRLKATVWAESRSRSRESTTLEVLVQFVTPLMVHSRVETLASPLHEGAKGSVSFVCYSMTRAGFDLQARDPGDDPCFECKCLPLTRDACWQLLGSKPELAAVLAGYRVEVTVHERHQGKQLDLGPFRHPIELSSSVLLAPFTVEVVGMVQGEVRIVPAASKNSIRLDDFPVDEGKSVTVTLAADRPDLKLALDSRYPEYLEVKLEEAGLVEGKKQWNLNVTVPPQRALGRLPRDSGIVLKILGPTPRGIRIPVSGHATVK